MPIYGLTDKGSSFPLLGRIRKGNPSVTRTNKQGKEYQSYGADTDHFRMDAFNPAINEIFSQKYGDSPKSLPILLPYATKDENFPAFMEEWAAGSMVRRCDGQKILMQLNGDSYSQNPGPCIRVMGGNCDCKEKGKLNVVLPEIECLGYFELLTGSVWDIIEISSNLAAINAATGTLRGVPLVVSRADREISAPGFGKTEGKRTRVTKSLLRLELEPVLQQRMMAGLRDAAIANFSPAPAMEAITPAQPQPSQPKQIQAAPAPTPVTDGNAVNWGAYTDPSTGGIPTPTPSPEMPEEAKFVLGYCDAAQGIAPTGRRAESVSYMAGRDWAAKAAKADLGA